ncbi:MAG: glycosyltransferase [Chloroflexota bacterium]
MSQPAILILTTQMEAGGTQKSALSLAQGLQQRGYSVIVVTMYDKDAYISTFNQQYGLEIIDLRMKSSGAFGANHDCFLRGLVVLFKLMRQPQIEIVQTFSYYSNMIGTILAAFSGVTVRVASQRGVAQNKNPWLRWLDKSIANSSFVHIMTTVSEDVRQHCIHSQGIKPEKLLTIYNGVDAIRYQIALSDTDRQAIRYQTGLHAGFVIITVARLHPVKGHLDLLDAIPHVKRVFPDVQFLWVGEGELEEMLRQQIYKLGLMDTVFLAGSRQDIPELLAISDLFVLPSHSEGMPNVILEAMAAGLPVVATAVGGIPEIVTEETGILVKPGDAGALAQAILQILQQADRNQLGQSAQKRVQSQFQVGQSIDKYEALYHSLQERK